jgi:hypothetical protein
MEEMAPFVAAYKEFPGCVIMVPSIEDRNTIELELFIFFDFTNFCVNRTGDIKFVSNMEVKSLLFIK